MSKRFTQLGTPARGAPGRGFTMIEAVLSLATISLVLLAALDTMGATVRSRSVVADERTGQKIAQELLTEILQSCYEEPSASAVFGREAGESSGDRTNWDDIDDYNGWAATPPRAKDDVELADFTGWTRGADVQKVTPDTLVPISDLLADTGVRLVTVTATSPSGRVTTLSAVRTDVTALEQAPTLDSAYTSHVIIELQLDSNPASRVRSAVDVLNQRPPLTAAGGAP